MQAAIYSSASHVSKAFQAFLASSACAASATSYPSCSAAPLPWPSGFSWAAPFFKAGRSLLAFGSNSAVKRTASPPLTLAVSRLETRFIQAMLFQTAFSFSGVIQRLAGRFSGLRLRAAWEFQAFLASSPYAASVSSYHSSSIAPPPWRCAFSPCWPVVKLGVPILASGSNTAVKPTRLRRSAYFGR